MDLVRVRFVLVRTRMGGNLGAAARAMKVAGIRRLVLVKAQLKDREAAARMAVHAGDVLEGARRVDDLASALVGATWVVGTSMRAFPGQRSLPPRAVAAEARSVLAAGGEVALVFGDEESGLANDDLLACHDASRVPTAPEQPSLNLAAAVQVYAYELHLASLEPGSPEPRERAPEEELGATERALRQVLESSGFVDPDRPGHGVRELAHTLRRAGLTTAEAKLWQAALYQAAGALVRKRLDGATPGSDNPRV